MDSVQLSCPQCSWRALCNQAEVEKRLRQLGLLRRAPHPPGELVAELLSSNSSRLKCDACAAVGLLVVQPSEDEPWDDWQQAVLCEVCKKPIPPARLEVFPTASRCVNCQNLADRGDEPDEPDYCPKCGSLVELRVSHSGGITRYKRFCTGVPPCRL